MEYALIVGAVGGAMLLGSLALGAAVKQEMGITAYGPSGTAYHCTANCQMDFKDYCAALGHVGGANPPVFSPALPAGGKCNGEVPVS